MIKLWKISFILLLISSQALSYPLYRRKINFNVNPESSDKIDYPDDVKEYTNKLEQCYKLKQIKNSNTTTTIEQAQISQLQCNHLQQDSQHMHYVYYQNTKIIDYINKFEKTYPFFGN